MSNAEQQAVDSADFESVLAMASEQYANTEVFSDWMPPPGLTVTVAGQEVRRGIKENEDGTKYVWWSVPGEIIEATDDALVGQSFNIQWCSTRDERSFRDAMRIYQACTGDVTHDAKVIDQFFASIFPSLVLTVETSSWTNKKTKASKTICKIVGVVETVEAAAPAPAPAKKTLARAVTKT